MTGSNVAFAGLTAAGKTTHATRLANDLGYDYVSATEILLEILGIEERGDDLWFTRLDEIHTARSDGAVDAELEDRLVWMGRTRQRTVFDTWALAWIGDDPLVRVWIESDIESRTRKCLVSQGTAGPGPADCRLVLDGKDRFNRDVFQRRHGFDLFTDRDRYDVVLNNSHLIPTATAAAADHGIEAFAPIVHAAVTCVLETDGPAAFALQRPSPREVRRVRTGSVSRA
jgi:cytidylate kinase